MSTGTQILLGVVIALLLVGGWLAMRRRRPAERRPVTPDLDARLRELAADGKQIVAIKELRQGTGMGLAEAKEHVDRLAAEPPAFHANPNHETRVRDLVASGKKIEAIKVTRQYTGMGLKEAKQYVESLGTTDGPPAAPRTELSLAAMAQVRALIAAGKTIQAVKLVREDTGWGLKQAKDFVDRL